MSLVDKFVYTPESLEKHKALLAEMRYKQVRVKDDQSGKNSFFLLEIFADNTCLVLDQEGTISRYDVLDVLPLTMPDKLFTKYFELNMFMTVAGYVGKSKMMLAFIDKLVIIKQDGESYRLWHILNYLLTNKQPALYKGIVVDKPGFVRCQPLGSSSEVIVEYQKVELVTNSEHILEVIKALNNFYFSPSYLIELALANLYSTNWKDLLFSRDKGPGEVPPAEELAAKSVKFGNLPSPVPDDTVTLDYYKDQQGLLDVQKEVSTELPPMPYPVGPPDEPLADLKIGDKVRVTYPGTYFNNCGEIIGECTKKVMPIPVFPYSAFVPFQTYIVALQSPYFTQQHFKPEHLQKL